MITRHSILCCFVSLFALASTLHATEWYRGNIHMHSFWSDGNVYPEQAVAWYKDNGYHFVVLSDHTYLQLNPQRWINVGTSAARVALFDQLVERFGQPDTREVEGNRQVRLRTINELKEIFDAPGQFLMIPGHEINDSTNGVTLHGLAINVTETIPFQRGDTLAESINRNALAVKRNGEENGHLSAFVLAHPNWPYYDIDPLSAVNARETILYEFLNADGCVSRSFDKAEDRFWGRELYWDIVTAFRTVRGYPLMFGVGADDTHNYTNIRDYSETPGLAWIMVRAEKLEPDTIVRAMIEGDFYVSTGVEMEEIAFDKETGTLSVKVKPVEGVNYRIQFIGTKKDFDQTVIPFQMERTERNPARRGWTFSRDIGIELAAFDGVEASYQLKEDDLYVRAIITSDEPKEIHGTFTPRTSSAWTQPFRR